MDQVHFSCRELRSEVTKYDFRVLWFSVLVYKLFECPFVVAYVLCFFIALTLLI